MLEIRAASRLARQSARKRLEPPRSGRRRDKHKMGEARLLEHGWAGLSDLYEPYLLSKEMSGKNRASENLRDIEDECCSGASSWIVHWK